MQVAFRNPFRIWKGYLVCRIKIDSLSLIIKKVPGFEQIMKYFPKIKKTYRNRHSSLDFKSNALTTWPRLLLISTKILRNLQNSTKSNKIYKIYLLFKIIQCERYSSLMAMPYDSLNKELGNVQMIEKGLALQQFTLHKCSSWIWGRCLKGVFSPLPLTLYFKREKCPFRAYHSIYNILGQ